MVVFVCWKWFGAVLVCSWVVANFDYLIAFSLSRFSKMIWWLINCWMHFSCLDLTWNRINVISSSQVFCQQIACQSSEAPPLITNAVRSLVKVCFPSVYMKFSTPLWFCCWCPLYATILIACMWTIFDNYYSILYGPPTLHDLIQSFFSK